jgi:hypothetical protein
MSEEVREVRMSWSAPQGFILREMSRFLNAEGAIRSGKTTAGIWKAINLCQEYPGIHGLLTRWTGDSLDAQIKPRFWELCPPELLTDPAWNAKEDYVQFENGSRLYIRALKSSDEQARFAKTSGLTLAFIIIDQPEEVPYDIYLYLKGRISQPGFPQQILLMPNPPEPDHWLCKEFPDGPQKPDHAFIRLSTYDNRKHLGEAYIKSLEDAYPPGHPLRRRLLEGRRGATQRGVPVYGKVFKPGLHVVKGLKPIPGVPVFQSWDFSFSHPACSWHQITPWGAWRTLLEWLGTDQYLEHAVPEVLRLESMMLRGVVCPIWTTCDPTGANPTSHGSERTAVRILQEHGLAPTVIERANQPAVRVYAIEQIARLMLRLTPEGAAYEIDATCTNLIDGFQAGYVYQDKLVRGKRIPLKDGYYDHLQNTFEYAALAYLVPEHAGDGAVMSYPGEEQDDDEARPTITRPTGRAGY